MVDTGRSEPGLLGPELRVLLMRVEVSARLSILAAALLFSTGGAAVKATALEGWQVAGWRSGIAAVAFLTLFPAARRRWTIKTVLVGLVYGATLVSYVLANKLTTSASAIFLQSTGPLYIVLLAPWLLREPIRRQDVGFMVVLGAALSVFFLTTTPVQSSAPQPALGNLMGAGSGVGWALTVMGLRWLGRGQDGADAALSATTVGNVLTFLFCAPMAFRLGHAGPTDYLVVAYLGLFQLGLAYVLLTSAIRHVPALQTSLLLLVEPALNPVWSWLVHREQPGQSAIIAGAVILTATAAKAYMDGAPSRAVRDRPIG